MAASTGNGFKKLCAGSSSGRLKPNCPSLRRSVASRARRQKVPRNRPLGPDGDHGEWNLRRDRLENEPQPGPSTSELTTVRRFVGIASALCALYLTVGPVDSPCNDHSSHAASSESNMRMAAHSDPTHPQPSPRKDRGPASCGSSAILCCVAICGSTILPNTISSSRASAPAREVAPQYQISRPLSRIAAPEPPPPKG